MKTILGALILGLLQQAAFAEGVTCEFNVSGLDQKVRGVASAKHKAHSNAVERCVELRTSDYESKHGGSTVSAEIFELFIDQCTTSRCE